MTHNFLWIWKLKVSKKIQSFFWLLFHDMLPTGAFLHHVGIQTDHMCNLCNQKSSYKAQNTTILLYHPSLLGIGQPHGHPSRKSIITASSLGKSFSLSASGKYGSQETTISSIIEKKG
uniref:Uncharacterized protein LOC104244268 n=1 Tax=Nicotiana sylvestris TaxID=4096 RepID=A0A1U7YFE4_NICSY|nr:PREDICTED: uncharacterized protein LOC104244268 [Nicotiana sylvestris]